MFLSVGFLYRSVTILPSIIEQEVSKNDKDFLGKHPQGRISVCPSIGNCGEVCSNVNLIFGCNLLISL